MQRAPAGEYPDTVSAITNMKLAGLHRQPKPLRTVSGTSPQQYRPEIDGLRAIAVLPVVFFHAGVPGFSGGFVGVDVFFVISGFLITRLVADEIRDGRFSILHFYERRIRRIFPALAFMLAGSTLAAAWLLYPSDYERFARSLVAAALFVSSFLFNRESGYFDGAAAEKPLLHTWSLSVEELFYLGLPVTLLVAKHLLGLRWRWVVIALAVASFTASVLLLGLDRHSTSAFYLIQYRAWELLLGAMLALYSTPHRVSRRAGAWIAGAGFLLILAAVVGYSEATRFPGIAALVPCLGAALIIGFGAEGRSGVSRVLTWRPVVFVGLISYSLYLWHWPIFVFFAHWSGRPATYWEAGGLILMAFLIAIVSWRWVEQPFRGAHGLLSPRMLASAAAVTTLALVAAGLHGELSAGWTSRYGEQLLALIDAQDDRDPREKECVAARAQPKGCDYGVAGVRPTLALWGDSHAAVYAVSLGRIAESHNEAVRVFTMWACPPTTNWQLEGHKWREACADLQDLALHTILTSPSIRTVVLAARFSRVPELEDREGATEAFHSTVDQLLAAGKVVVVAYPVPEISHYQAGARQLRVVSLDAGPALVSQRTPDFLAANREAFRWLDNLGERENLYRIYPHEALCDQNNCYAARDGVGYYFDDQHLSLRGANLLAPAFDSLLYPDE